MIFIDTGAHLARYLKRDRYHRKALAGWEKIRKTGSKCYTSNLVLAETFTLLARWAGYSFAVERAHAIYGSSVLQILRPGPDDEVQAVAELEKFADQKVSFTDCVSFVLMRRNRLRRVFTFDRHFQLAGFSLWIP